MPILGSNIYFVIHRRGELHSPTSIVRASAGAALRRRRLETKTFRAGFPVSPKITSIGTCRGVLNTRLMSPL